MTARLIRLRLFQLYRGSGDIGLFRVLLLAGVLLPLGVLFMIQRITVHPWPLLFPAGVLLVVGLIHSHRRDYNFLRSVTPSPHRIFFAEYFLFTLPAAVLLLSASLYLNWLVFCSILALISFTVPARRVISSTAIRLKIIPAGMFEWKSGVRKNLVVIVLFYIPGLFGFYQVWLSAVSLFLLTMVFVSFYAEYEPRNVLVISGQGPAGFLTRKIFTHAGCFAVILLPLVLIACTHAGYRWIIVGYYLASLNLVTFAILLKYYQYRPAAYSGAHQLLTMMACIFSVVLPVGLLIAMANLILAAGACRNLKPYLYDLN
jgi:hypothetical protein